MDTPVPSERLNRQLWQKFIHLAQPYWLPQRRNSTALFLGLLLLLLIFLTSFLVLGVIAISAAAHHWRPQPFDAIAPGLWTMIQQLGLPFVGGVGLGLVIPLGLWNEGAGTIIAPATQQMMFLPQHPYMPLGHLRHQLLYPYRCGVVADETLQAALEQVNLADLPERVGGWETDLDWVDVLSLGEQQRLAFARLLLSQPRYAILDEATSALDVENEARLYQRLREQGTTVISVGHRHSLVHFHDWLLEFDGTGNWQCRSLENAQLQPPHPWANGVDSALPKGAPAL
jgi:ABC-type uncharacterized transport system fused permease/ATPase subunit